MCSRRQHTIHLSKYGILLYEYILQNQKEDLKEGGGTAKKRIAASCYRRRHHRPPQPYTSYPPTQSQESERTKHDRALLKMAQSELPPGVSEQDMALVKGIDNLCTTLYSTPDESARKSADEQLARVFYDAGVGQSSASKAYTVVVSADGIKSSAVAADIKAVPLHEKMLSLSSCGFTLHFSSRALLIIVSNCWQVLDAQQRLQLRDFAFNCFVAKGPRVPKLAVNALITLTCRITKRGWCESPQYHQVVAEMMQLLPSQDPFYRQLGLRFLSELIEEMQAIRIQGHLRSGRAAAIAFRDQGLRDIFTSVKRLLQDLSAEACDIEEYSDEEAFLQLTLETLLACLSYDFDVSNPDRSNDDLSITRVPRAWSDTRDETTIGLFFEIYQARPGTRCASLALECVGKLASLRRSLFSKDERMALVQRLQRETLMIMGSSQVSDLFSFLSFSLNVLLQFVLDLCMLCSS